MKVALALLAFIARGALAAPEVTTETYAAVDNPQPPSNLVETFRWGPFHVKIPEHTVKILYCPTGTGINITEAAWVAKINAYLDTDRVEPYRLERTAQLNMICRGHNNCVLQPVAHLDKVTTDYYQFFGIPFENASYVLEIKGSCDPNPLSPLGRKNIASVDPAEDLVMGCLEGEVINLSYVRGSCIGSHPRYRQLYHNRSFMTYVYAACQNKRNCTIQKSMYPPDDRCSFTVVDALYYCRSRISYAYVDVVKKDNETVHVLTAEEDSHVSVKAPAGKVLKVRSVAWDVIGKQEEVEDPKRNRLDLVQFYCEGRSSCSFVPKRTSNGLLEMHLGGITSSSKKRFTLKAEFTTSDEKEQLDEGDIKKSVAKKGQKIEMTCDQDKPLRVVSALWGGVVTDPHADKGRSIFWVDMKQDDGTHRRVTEIGAYLERIVFNKHDLTYDPFESSVISVPGRPQLPLIPGVATDDHELVVKYVCMNLGKAPSVSDSELTSPTNIDEYMQKSNYQKLDKEKIIEFQLEEDDQIVIMIEQKDDSVVKVGEYITLNLPYKTTEYKVALTEGEHKKHTVETQCDNVITSIIISDNWRVEITTNFYKGKNLVQTFVDELMFDESNKFEKKFKDAVVATGGVVGMRVLHRPNDPSKYIQSPRDN